MDNPAIEVGLLEKRVKKPRYELLLIVCTGFAHLVACLALFIYYEDLYKCSTRGTAAIIGVSMGGLSESLVQLYTRKCSLAGIVKFQVWGALNGIWTRCWTEKLHELETPLFMVFLDQLIGNPLSVFFFTGLSAFWQGYDVDLYVKKNYVPTLKASLFIWPLASALQFTVIPESHIVLFNVVVGFLWVLILGVLPRTAQ